jgi:signal transduction histidine kinase/ActR/RegA family two-component response regulator
MSFRYKFILSFIVIEAIFVTMIVLFNVSSLQHQSNTLIDQNTQTTSRMFAEIVKTPLLGNDLTSLEDITLRLASMNNIVYIEVLDELRNPLSSALNISSHYKNESLQTTLTNALKYKQNEVLVINDKKLLLFEEEIIIDLLGKNTLGYVRFVYDITGSLTTIENNLWGSIAIIALELLFSALIASLLGFRVTQALDNLTQVANKISKDEDVEIPPYKDNGDEISALSKAMKLMQYNINERTQALSEAQQRALKASKAKSEFLAVMSHEIRTPLNGMIGSLNLIDTKQLPQRDAEYISMIKASSDILIAVINDILDYSKIEAGKFSLDKHVLSVNNMLAEVDEFYRSLIENKGLEFVVEKHNIDNLYIQGDAIRIKQILNNYLNNAIKFTAKGKITLIAKKLENNEVYFAVVDTGIGINKSDLPNLFKDFSQLNTGSNRKFGGTGLGLAISRKLANLMNGTTAVDSEYGKGSTFSVTLKLPIASQKIYEQENQKIDQTKEAAQNNLDADVLLVEDNRTNQMIASRLLEKAGCNVAIANNGVESIEQLQQKQFDIVLMDCQMPIMDGYEASQAIRKSGNHIPIIALTANAQQTDREACLNAGMTDFLSKPFKPDVLYQKIRANLLAKAA